MDSGKMPSPEELEKMLEKAKEDAKAAWEKLTPEERAQAELRAKRMMEEDRASMQALLDQAAEVAAGTSPKAKAAAKFCTNCGAPLSGGNFCPNCGSPVERA